MSLPFDTSLEGKKIFIRHAEGGSPDPDVRDDSAVETE